MQGTQYFDYFRNAVFLAVLTIALSGCLMGEEKAKSDDEIAADNQLSGSIGDGPIVGATVSVMQNDGEQIAQIESDSTANYSVMIRTKGMYYPLTITAHSGIDLVTNQAPDFDLLGAVFSPSRNSIANVNPFSTFAVEVARDLPGGISSGNLDTAEEYVVDALNSGLTSLAASGPMRSRIDLTNIAEMVKASETLAETVRRTRDLQLTFGRASSGNQVIGQIASDLTDSIVDGRGGSRTDARTSAIASVVAVQVFLEAAQNELRVNGQDASAAMAAAVDQVTSSPPVKSVAQQRVTRDMINAVRLGLDASIAVDNNPGLVTLRQAMNGVQSGMDSSLVRTLIPSDYRQTLDAALLVVAGGDATVIDTVNDVVRSGGSGPTVNSVPTISGTPGASIMVGVNYSYTPTADDADGDLLTFSITGRPAWANFDTASGSLTGTPTMGDVGTYNNIGISVSDGNASSSLPTFSISVSMTNSAPTISGAPTTQIRVNGNYSFTPTANDPDGDALTFSVTGLPPWASFDNSNGRISGVPGAADVGTYNNIRITVSDGSDSASLAPFSITVSVANSAPTISGTPPTQVNAGENYSFTPTANDPDGNPLSFSVALLPPWASFNNSNGNISGTPGAADVGTYNNIRITVSDGTTSASLAAFTITVQSVSLGSVTLNWTPPTQNDDGSPLLDLDGYRIYWGTTPGSYPNSVTIDNEGLSSYVVDNLVPGTYEFVATSFNTSGVESVYSDPATKIVP